MSLADSMKDEIAGIARRLEYRVRQNPDADIEKAAALLRLMTEALATDERKAWRAAAKLRRLN
jgi:hypothetical protein